MLQTVCINSIEHLFEHISTFARELLTYFTLFRFTVYYRILLFDLKAHAEVLGLPRPNPSPVALPGTALLAASCKLLKKTSIISTPYKFFLTNYYFDITFP
jgi:hypothetical protein